MQSKDLTYHTFGRLFIIYRTEHKHSRWHWWCHCACGNFIEVPSNNLTSGNTRSCGCLRDDGIAEVNKTHGFSGSNATGLYQSWKNMRRRCLSPSYHAFSRYGGRGIAICSEWGEFSNFRTWSILHGWHEGLTIDRVDVDKGYYPENCEWVSAEENLRRRWHSS